MDQLVRRPAGRTLGPPNEPPVDTRLTRRRPRPAPPPTTSRGPPINPLPTTDRTERCSSVNLHPGLLETARTPRGHAARATTPADHRETECSGIQPPRPRGRDRRSHAAPRTDLHAARLRALIVVPWRARAFIHEAFALRDDGRDVVAGRCWRSSGLRTRSTRKSHLSAFDLSY